MVKNLLNDDLNMLKNKLIVAIGNFLYVEVSRPIRISENEYVINIFINYTDYLCNCIRQIIPNSYSISGQTVYIKIFNSNKVELKRANLSYTKEEVADLFFCALYNNVYFKGCMLTEYYVPKEIMNVYGDILVITVDSLMCYKEHPLNHIDIDNILNEIFISEYLPNIRVSFINSKNIFFYNR